MIERTRKGVLLASAAILLFLGSTCSNEPSNNGTANTGQLVDTEPARQENYNLDAMVTGGELAFVTDAAPVVMGKIELGKLAASKAQNADVKAFGQKMVEDHSKAMEDLKALMVQKKVVLPPDVMPTHTELMEKLSTLSGSDFDKEYVKAMVAAYEKDVAAFENISKTAVDADVKAFAAKTLPTLKMHLEMIKTTAKKMDVNKKS